MKLVMIYNVSDGCTYSCENTVPIIYKSAEDALADFEKIVKAENAKMLEAMEILTFWFGEQEFCADDFYEGGVYYPPRFLTIDEWFEDCISRHIAN